MITLITFVRPPRRQSARRFQRATSGALRAVARARLQRQSGGRRSPAAAPVTCCYLAPAPLLLPLLPPSASLLFW